MPSHAGPNILGESNLVFAYNTGDTVNSFRGQPTTNDYGSNFRDFTGTGYSPYGEWISTEPTRFTKTYYPNLNTPIGPGGTLIEESGTAGYHHLSRYGGGDESGAHSLSCYIYPLVSGITDFCIGMLGDSSSNIRFNLDTRVITYGGGISNTNAFIRDVPGYPGWLRVGANIEGRGGGWVGCFGYTSYTTYTGTAGGKGAYITGIQYEYITQPTSFVAGTRSVTQGLLPVIGNSTIDLTNVSFDSNAQMTFDGTNDYIATSTAIPCNFGTGDFAVEVMIYPQSFASYTHMVALPSQSTFALKANISDGAIYYYDPAFTTYGSTSGWTLTLNQWNHVVLVRSGNTAYGYLNGVLKGSKAGFNTNFSSTQIVNVGNGGTSEYTQKEVDIVKIYNRALTAQEVKQNYQQYKTRFNLS